MNAQSIAPSKAEYRSAKLQYWDILHRLDEASSWMNAANSRRKTVEADAAFHGRQAWHERPLAEYASATAAYGAVRAEQDTFYTTARGQWYCPLHDQWDAIGGPATPWQLADFLEQHLEDWNTQGELKGSSAQVSDQSDLWDRTSQCTIADARRIERAARSVGFSCEPLGPTPTLRQIFVATERLLHAAASATDVGGSVKPDPVAVAVTMKVNDPSLTIRKVAAAVGMHYSTLAKHPLWKASTDRMKQVGASKMRRGGKSKDGDLEAIDD